MFSRVLELFLFNVCFYYIVHENIFMKQKLVCICHQHWISLIYTLVPKVTVESEEVKYSPRLRLELESEGVEQSPRLLNSTLVNMLVKGYLYVQFYTKK